MAKITEKSSTRVFTLEVSEKELQFIQRAVYKDDTNGDENGDLYGEIDEFMSDNGVDTI